MDVLRDRRWLLVPTAVLAGVLVGLIISLASSASRRAEASVLISSPQGPASVTPQLANLRELATSGVLAGNVRSTLRLEESVADLRGRLDADVKPDSQVIVVAATHENSEAARQIAQEAAIVFTRLVDARFRGRTPPLQAAVIDSAHVLSARNRHFVRNGLIGAAAGFLLGVAAVALLGGVPQPVVEPAARDLREREKSLERRIKEVTKRERELAKHAGRLAAREHELATQTATSAPPPPERNAQPVPAAAPPAAAVSPAPALTRGGGWNVNELERAVEGQTDVPAETIEEWRTYLFFLRDHAAIDGSLPSQFDGLVEDIFAPLFR